MQVHWCDYCGLYIQNNLSSISHHSNSLYHQKNTTKFLSEHEYEFRVDSVAANDIDNLQVQNDSPTTSSTSTQVSTTSTSTCTDTSGTSEFVLNAERKQCSPSNSTLEENNIEVVEEIPEIKESSNSFENKLLRKWMLKNLPEPYKIM